LSKTNQNETPMKLLELQLIIRILMGRQWWLKDITQTASH
jgi:hypothetical protein